MKKKRKPDPVTKKQKLELETPLFVTHDEFMVKVPTPLMREYDKCIVEARVWTSDLVLW